MIARDEATTECIRQGWLTPQGDLTSAGRQRVDESLARLGLPPKRRPSRDAESSANVMLYTPTCATAEEAQEAREKLFKGLRGGLGCGE